MSLKTVGRKASSAAKAEFVRAFYDAADRFVEAQENGQGGSGAEASALQELSDIIDRAKEVDSAEFTAALQRAAGEYFSRISQIKD